MTQLEIAILKACMEGFAFYRDLAIQANISYTYKDWPKVEQIASRLALDRGNLAAGLMQYLDDLSLKYEEIETKRLKK